MLQIVLEQPGRFVAADVPPPSPAAGEALVSIRRIGVCGTDLHAHAGRQPFFEYPRILGHELGVEIVAAPANKFGLAAGDRCAVEPYVYCGSCSACRRGRTNCCERLRVLGVHVDGGMRSLLNVPLRLLHRSRRLTLDQLALVETLGIGGHAVRRGGVQPGEEVLVVGAGPIGLAVVQFAWAAGGNVRVLELSPARRAFVETLGAATLEAYDGRPADVVFDATGNRRAMEASFDYVAQAGRIVLVGIVLDRVSFDDPAFHRRELTILASRNSAGLFPEIIRMIEEGRIDTTPWITHRMPLASVPEQFAQVAAEPTLVKAMIEA
jgi:2-desacetyl-2-hydroxyethyl bacteriochlorophyllide A dehydrogenase